MGFIPQDVIGQVLDRANIVEVISGYIPLRPAGRNFKAPCPFHHEKTPSFIVNPDKQIFHCFGCGAGGNVITFVMKQERMEFPEALRFLAEKTGIQVPETDARNDQAHELRRQIVAVNELAVKYYHQHLLSDKSGLGNAAREYLKSRGLNLERVTKFQLGLAPEAWDGLLRHLSSQNFTPGFLEKAGLVLPRSKGEGHYDRFRERIIFPIFDARGQAVAFGARALDKDNSAKYINSPETPLYTKGNFLYGLNWAKDAVSRKDSVVVVEGYMDFITPFAAGVENIAASLGTALTAEQIRLIRRYTKNVVMLFDADPAGQAAIMRSLDLLVEEGMTVKVASLTSGEDPDSYVRKFGGPSFEERIAQADSLFDFKLKFLTQKFSSGSVEDNARIAGAMLATIAKFDNAIIRSEYLKQLARALKVQPEALDIELKKIKPVVRAAEGFAEVARKTAEPIPPAERHLLRLLLEERDFISLSRREIAIADLQSRPIRDIVAKIFELFDSGHESIAPVLMNCFEDQEVLDIISGIVASEELIVGDRQKIYRDCTQRLRLESAKEKRQEIQRRMDEAHKNGDEKTVNDLTIALNQLVKTKGI